MRGGGGECRRAAWGHSDAVGGGTDAGPGRPAPGGGCGGGSSVPAAGWEVGAAGELPRSMEQLMEIS